MFEAGLFDGCFPHQLSASLGGENSGESSQLIRWVRGKHLPVTFYTDTNLDLVTEAPPGERSVAWLIEPPSLSDTHYQKAWDLYNFFDYILTFNLNMIPGDRNDKWLYYAYGGSWIALPRWGIPDKTKMVSLIASQKKRAKGHQMRHAAARLANVFKIDVVGRGYQPLESTYDGLHDYRYSIVIESCQCWGYFSEKLIDCLSQGTIPIYWGDRRTIEHAGFDMNGIIMFNTLDELTHIILNVMSSWDYGTRMTAIQNNIGIAHRYRCCEDLIALQYHKIWEAK